MEKRSILYFVLIVSSIALSFFLSIFAFGFDLIGFLGFAITFIMVIVGAILYVIKSIKNKNMNFIELILIIICLLGVYKAEQFSREFIKQREQVSIGEGNKIIHAVNIYFIETGKYPERLNELTPKYLDEIPESTVFLTNDEFKYSYLKEKNIYWITFRRPAQLIFKYRSDYKKWIETD